MMPYQLKVRLLKLKMLNILWRYWRAWRGDYIGEYSRLPEFIKNYASGNSFIDIGCMWGVNGEYAFIAEEAGASSVKGVDIFGPTPEFEAKKQERNSSVEFILGDIGTPETLETIGLTDVVFCAGVLYHHPSPFDLLVAFRRICNKTLILRTSTIPEVEGLPNAAVYFPMLTEKDRRLWNLKSLGTPRQVGIEEAFIPEEGYGNWFWGLTPSCLTSLLETAGFKVDLRFNEAFVQTFICTPVDVPFAHHLPNDVEAKQMGKRISDAKIARCA